MTIGPSTSPLSGVATYTITSIVIAASAPAVSAARTTTSPIGAIVGGIAGGFALLLLMLAFFLWYRGYQHETLEDVGPETHDMRGHPFQVLQSSSPAATPRPGVLSATPSTRLASTHEAPVDNNAYASEHSRAPEPQTLAMTSRTYTVDDADGQIKYSDGWTKEGSGQEFNTTTTWTATRGAFFTFTFLGTSVKVFGTSTGIDPQNPHMITNITYEVDDGSPAPFSGPNHTKTLYHQLFYASPPLQFAVHTLVSTCIDCSLVFLDYLEIEIPLSLPISATVTGSQTTLSATAITTDRISHSQTPLPTIAMIGGVLGTLVFILASIFIYICYRQFRRSAAPTICAHSDVQTHNLSTSITTNQDILVDVERHKPLQQ
ncbi:hypothetical protein PC9H_011554 [Pleurotus ostreatus]|uniref:Transmembrane protein n=1 Tax=Pleurotus ostreatus TaxID=5322 RepID=A0A8H7DPC9_PLEOS|nr:uncharacterized protein PC9H_011554 [Pleurotus ostreatus]KAF7421034.1 hypothetical protein PC9H_011554 [Pleurotus ostreatus]